MSASDTHTAQSELEAHHQAYFHIFQTVIKKRGLAPEQQQQTLARIKAYQQTKIKNSDDYLDHIPVFARALGVRADQLGAFIGSNLLKALHQVEERMAAQRKVTQNATKIKNDPEIQNSILKELVSSLGSLIAAPDHFQNMDMGLLALSIGGRIHQSASAAASNPMSASPIAEPAVDNKAAGRAPVGEVSILEEILSKLGAALKVDSRLEVPDFPREMAAEMAAATPTIEADTQQAGPLREDSILSEIVNKLGAALKTEAKLVVPDFPREMAAEMAAATPTIEPASGADVPTQETSILEEILNKIGGALKADTKLVVPAFPADMQAAMDPLGSVDTAGPEDDSAEEFEALDLSFGDFCDALRKVQQFQTQKDAQGYQQWLNQEASPGTRIALGIRKIDARLQKDPGLNRSEELYNLAVTNEASLEQTEELQQRLQRYQRMYQLQNQFVARVKTQPPVVLQAFQKIWPQVKLIVDDESELEGRMQRLKIPMLQITNPKLKAAVTNMLKTYFTKLGEFENG
ncbi:MAG: hypothetical protein KDK39_02840 [Leptospiraceae bacterium]|nr:hypothetical protein [Leptospiraceae bacterium]